MGKYIVFYLLAKEGREVVRVIQRARDILAVFRRAGENVTRSVLPGIGQDLL